MDLDLEIAKADKKLGLAIMNLDKVKKVESQPNYEGTIPADVRLANEEKVCVPLSNRKYSSNRPIALTRGRSSKWNWRHWSLQKRCLQN